MIDDLERIDNERFRETSGWGTVGTSRHQRAVIFTPAILPKRLAAAVITDREPPAATASPARPAEVGGRRTTG